jgi:hypothetical protein
MSSIPCRTDASMLCLMGVKGKQQLSAHFIAIAAIVAHSAQIVALLQIHRVLSILHQTQQVIIQNAVVKIREDMLGDRLIPVCWTDLSTMNDVFTMTSSILRIFCALKVLYVMWLIAAAAEKSSECSTAAHCRRKLFALAGMGGTRRRELKP